MKTSLMKLTAVVAFAFPIAYADAPIELVDAALKAGDEYGLKYYTEFEFDDDDGMEIEGWADNQWFAEIRVSAGGEIIREVRERRDGGSWGMSSADVRETIEAAKVDGMTTIEEISIESDGNIEVEGENSEGREVELNRNQAVSKAR